MKLVLANLALLFGIIGFVGYLFIILASAFHCCMGLTTATFYKVVLFILSAAVVTFAVCMFNNCCKVNKQQK